MRKGPRPLGTGNPAGNEPMAAVEHSVQAIVLSNEDINMQVFDAALCLIGMQVALL